MDIDFTMFSSTDQNLCRRAAQFGSGAHAQQKRKYTGEPYFNHCIEVAMLVRSVNGTAPMVAAAFLHDTVEDCDVSISTIREEFGDEVASLVDYLTDVSKPGDGNRARRKEIDRLHTSSASPEAKTIKLADLIANTSSIVRHDPNFAKIYMKEKRRLLEVLTEGDARLYKVAEELSASYEAGNLRIAVDTEALAPND